MIQIRKKQKQNYMLTYYKKYNNNYMYHHDNKLIYT